MTLANEYDINFNCKKIQRLMRKYQIICPIRKADPYRRIAKAMQEHWVVSNVLNYRWQWGLKKLIPVLYRDQLLTN